MQNEVRHARTIITQTIDINFSEQLFCNTMLKFQSRRTVSKGNHFLYIYILFFA